MNRYSVLARQYWQKHLPEKYGALSDPTSFFAELGEQVEARIDELMEARRPQLGSDYLSNLKQLNAAKNEAENEALRELVLLTPASEET